MESLLTGVSTAIALVGDVFTAITANPYLATIAGAGLLTLGTGLFSALRGASHG